jgi:site-specific recombinase
MTETAGRSASNLAGSVLEYFPELLRRKRDVRALSVAIAGLGAAESLEDRLDALHALVNWTRRSNKPPVVTPGMRGVPQQFQRLALLLEVLEHRPAPRRALQHAFIEIVAETEGANLIGEAGLPSERGFLAEFSDRFIERLLPRPRDDHDLASVLARLFRTRAQVSGVTRMPLGLFGGVVNLLDPEERHGEIWGKFRKDFVDGLRLLATRVRAQGLAEKVRARSPRTPLDESPFFRLTANADALASTWQRKASDPKLETECRELIGECRSTMNEIARRIEASGVSVDVVYGLEMIDRCLTRLGQMVSLMQDAPEDLRTAQLHDFMSRLISATHRDRSLGALLSSSLQLLQRKIVERSSRTGEHYVAHDHGEYLYIWAAAAGGGAVAGLMAVAKFPVLAAGLPPFVEGLLATLVYVAGFMTMHTFGLVLATKQPAMTAATLAAIAREYQGAERRDEIAEFFVRIFRSQVAATLSNILAAGVVAIAFERAWRYYQGSPYLAPAEALHAYEAMNPLASGTVVFAALTGVLLWLASLAGGWLDNWSAYHRIPQAIADHPIGNVIGWKRTARLAGIWSRNVADWGTNVALAILLGMTPVLGLFFGLPLDVRHVTLSTGKMMVGMACLDLPWTDWRVWLVPMGAVATMFVLNLGVSFLLALNTALRAYEIDRSDMGAVIVRVLRRFLSTPLDFVRPPRTPRHDAPRDVAEAAESSVDADGETRPGLPGDTSPPQRGRDT